MSIDTPWTRVDSSAFPLSVQGDAAKVGSASVGSCAVSGEGPPRGDRGRSAPRHVSPGATTDVAIWRTQRAAEGPERPTQTAYLPPARRQRLSATIAPTWRWTVQTQKSGGTLTARRPPRGPQPLCRGRRLTAACWARWGRGTRLSLQPPHALKA
eukprot:287337-Chlamydomonas_euryale.AAC.1